MKKTMKRAFYTPESYLQVNNPRGMREYTGIHDNYPIKQSNPAPKDKGYNRVLFNRNKHAKIKDTSRMLKFIEIR